MFPWHQRTNSDRNKQFFFYLSSLKIDEKDQEKLCLIRSKCSLWQSILNFQVVSSEKLLGTKGQVVRLEEKKENKKKKAEKYLEVGV